MRTPHCWFVKVCRQQLLNSLLTWAASLGRLQKAWFAKLEEGLSHEKLRPLEFNLVTTLQPPQNTNATFSARDYRNCMGSFATGVAVITAGESQRKTGMTVNSITSVSLDPPLLLFCPKNGSHTLATIEQDGTFAVNFLAADQEELCGRFAGRCDGDRFEGVAHSPGRESGAPLLEGSLAQLECRVQAIHPGGDHAIVVAEVVGLRHNDEVKEPLLFWAGKIRESAWT